MKNYQVEVWEKEKKLKKKGDELGRKEALHEK